MPDEPIAIGFQDPSRIDVHENREVRYWMQQLRASSKEIKRAVRLVGSRVDKVREHVRLHRVRRRTAH